MSRSRELQSKACNTGVIRPHYMLSHVYNHHVLQNTLCVMLHNYTRVPNPKVPLIIDHEQSDTFELEEVPISCNELVATTNKTPFK